MPQFDFSTYSSQIFWLLLCFGIFFSYVKFYFLPKLEGILKQRNEEIANANWESERNNKIAKENFEQSQKIARENRSLAEKVIAEAEAKAHKQEVDAMAYVNAKQKQIISEMLANQKAELSQDVVEKAVLECSKIVLKKIGFEPTDEDIKPLIK